MWENRPSLASEIHWSWLSNKKKAVVVFLIAARRIHVVRKKRIREKKEEILAPKKDSAIHFVFSFSFEPILLFLSVNCKSVQASLEKSNPSSTSYTCNMFPITKSPFGDSTRLHPDEARVAPISDSRCSCFCRPRDRRRRRRRSRGKENDWGREFTNWEMHASVSLPRICTFFSIRVRMSVDNSGHALLSIFLYSSEEYCLCSGSGSYTYSMQEQQHFPIQYSLAPKKINFL